MQGIDVFDTREILMNEYCVTATELDYGTGCPWGVYAMKPYFRINGEWFPSDFTKIGKAQSIANRQRAYNQVGSDTRLFWSVTTNSRNNVKRLESQIHRLLREYYAGPEVIGTELFKLDCNQTYSVIETLFETISNIRYVHTIDVFKEGNKDTIFYRDWDQLPGAEYLPKLASESFNNFFEVLE